MFTFYRRNNDEAILIRLLKKLKINISTQTVIAELERHPDYPSLLSISDVLKNFGIENGAIQIDFVELETLPCPFIAHIRGGSFIVVDAIAALIYPNLFMVI